MIRDAGRIRVGGNVQASTIKKRVQPVYPAEAKSRRIQGAVHFNVVIDKEGKVQSLILTGGPFALYKAGARRGFAMGVSAGDAQRPTGRSDHDDRCQFPVVLNTWSFRALKSLT